MLDAARLSELVSAGESSNVEFKQSLSKDSEIGEIICAFANDLAGSGKPGHLLFGVENTGRIAGVAVTDAVLQRIAQLRVDGKITPTPAMDVQTCMMDGKPVIAVEVWPSDSPPVRRAGTAFVRVGTVTTKATPEEERRLVELRRARALPFDARGLAGSRLGEIDLRKFQLGYLPLAVSAEVLAGDGRKSGEQLPALKLTDQAGQITPTGLLVLGFDPLRRLPGAYIQFRKVAGREIADETIDQARMGGTIDVAVRQIEEKL